MKKTIIILILLEKHRIRLKWSWRGSPTCGTNNKIQLFIKALEF